MKVVTEVPENYQTRVKKGSQLKISIPDAGIDSLDAVINLTGVSITSTSRGFITEAKIPSLPGLRLNQVALVHIKDYTSANALIVPVNVVQTDEKGKYLYVIVQEGTVTKARKKQVTVGEIYNGMIEVKSGLTITDKIITEGHQSVYDGQMVTTEVK